MYSALTGLRNVASQFVQTEAVKRILGLQEREEQKPIKYALCVETEAFQEVGLMIVPEMNFFLEDRDICETDTTTLQLLPYMIIRDQNTGKFFRYTRGQKGQESRLHGKTSLGVGGHVDTAPPADCSIWRHLAMEAVRELQEEIGYSASYYFVDQLEDFLKQQNVNYMYLPESSSQVDRVHLGLIYVVNIGVDADMLAKLEEGVICDPQWFTKEELMMQAGISDPTVSPSDSRMETWTRLAVGRNLLSNQQYWFSPVEMSCPQSH